MLLLFPLNILIADGESVNFRHITVEKDGLSESTVYNIFQDSRGYIWISTDNGLNKYDGHIMKSYQYMHFDENSISKGAPRHIFEDMDGFMWIATDAGIINKLDPQTEKFTQINLLENSTLDIVTINQLPDGRMICVVGGYIIIMDKNGKKLNSFKVVSNPAYKNDFYKNLKLVTEKKHVLAEIKSPGNSINESVVFKINFEDSLTIVMMAEHDFKIENGLFDYGWIENSDGEKVWSPWEKDTLSSVYAGGHWSNRITVENIKLPRGDYKIRFTSDGAYSPDRWTLTQPDFPQYWGIGVYKNTKNIKLDKELVQNDYDYKNNVQDLIINEDGTIWLSNKTGMVLFRQDLGVVASYKTKYKSGLRKIVIDPYDTNYIWCLGMDLNKNNAEMGQLCRFNKSTRMFKYFDIDPDKSDDFIFNPNGLEILDNSKVWLKSDSQGILKFDYLEGTVKHLSMDRNNDNALRDNNINFLFRDRAGAMWVSTSTMGISVYDPYYQKFGLIPYKQGFNRNSFPQPNISKLNEHPNGSVMILNGGELYLYNSGIKKLSKYDIRIPKSFYVEDFIVNESTAHFFCHDKMNDIRVLVKYDLQLDKILRKWSYQKDGQSTSIRNMLVEEILFDRQGNLWVGDLGNWTAVKINNSDIFINQNTDLSIFEGDKLQLVTFFKKVSRYLSGSIPKTFFEDKDGIIWIGTDKGTMFKIDVVNRKIKTFRHNPSDSTSIPSGTIITMSDDNRNNLWVGTWPTGMFKFDKKKEIAKRYYEREGGLIDNTVNAIIQDNDGYIWISTKNGICKFNPIEDTFLEYYYAKDGLQSNEFLFDAALKSSNGTIFFGGSNGVSYIEPENIFKNPNLPIVDISSVYKNGKIIILDSNKKSTQTLEVLSKDRSIGFEYNGLNYTRSEKNKYKYKMDGYDLEWINAGERRFANYTNLPAGKYTFKVMGANNDGLWSANSTNVNVIVYPPVWRTWWAYALYIFTLVGMIFMYVKYIERKNLKENEELRKSEELELARQFQLDLLPSKVIQHDDYEIIAYIETATEVGGDYYDFFQQPDGSIYVVAGDATGHGMTAGMMVSITKAGLHGISDTDTKEIMNKLNNIIKSIELGKNRMALNIGHLKEDIMQFSSAGMPPIYIYDSENKSVQEILQVGLPLGSLKKDHYVSETYRFKSGDKIIFLSDGLPEATNLQNEMLGYDAVLDCINHNIKQSPDELMKSLVDLGNKWMDSKPIDDDITILIVEKK